MRRAVVLSSAVAFTVACASANSSRPATPATAPAPPTDLFVRTRAGASETFIPAQGEAALQSFVPDVAAEEDGGECSLVRTGGSGATIVTAFYPKRSLPRMQVTTTFDSGGRLVRYSERRGIPHFAPAPGATPEQIDSLIRKTEASIRSTTINMDYAVDQAIVSNRGGGKPTVAVLGTVRAVERLEKLGPPAARLERMRKLCGV
jgi:hypothetical protein